MDTFEYISNSPGATLELGKKIGGRIAAGSIIALVGELGSGKTLLTRGVGEGLGVPPRQMSSPTFVLVNEYHGRLPVFHLDLYRLDNIDQEYEIGIIDYFSRAESGVMIIEWAEKMLSILPPDILKVELDILSQRKRMIRFSSTGDKFNTIFKGIRK